MPPGQRLFRHVIIALALATSMLVIDGVSPAPLQESSAEAVGFGQATIELDDSGPTPESVYLSLAFSGNPQLTWRNASSRTLTVTTDTGVIDSGPIPPGAEFVVGFPVAGTHVWTSEVGGGTISVVVDDVRGTGTDLASSRLVETLEPPMRPDEVQVHPDRAILSATGRFIVGLTSGATVDDVNDLLNRTRASVIGWSSDLGALTLGFPTVPTTFRSVDDAVALARTLPGVDFAAPVLFEVAGALPPPTDPGDDRDPGTGQSAYEWTDPLDFPEGGQFNVHLETTRVPAAWNLRQATEARGGPRSTTLVVDSGFEAHDDLDRLDVLELCRIQPTFFSAFARLCTSQRASDHGNHVFGIIGADYDDVDASGLGEGTTGIDPYSRLHALTHKLNGDTEVRFEGQKVTAMSAWIYQLIYDEIRSGRLGDVSVINHSIQFTFMKDEWVERWRGETCGPGADDAPDATEDCTPENEDGYIADISAHARLLGRVMDRIAALPDPPLITAAAGNRSASICVGLPETCDATTGDFIEMSSSALTTMGWLHANWPVDAPHPSPIVVVGSLGNLGTGFPNSSDRSRFSNLDVDVSAPGLIYSTESSAEGEDIRRYRCSDQPDDYCFQNGTSQAAPAVAGMLGLLLGWDPTLLGSELRTALTAWADPATNDRAGPAADAYAMLTSLPGTTEALADLSDPSDDGNRRVLLDPNGAITSVDDVMSTTPGELTEPDGNVDVRDFRRFRDAWLATCELRWENGCPTVVDLNGEDDAAKRDLNGDGCINWAPPKTPPRSIADLEPCPSELIWGRFDLNGDGLVSLRRTAIVGRDADTGALTTGRATTRPVTDLDVFMWHFGAGPDPVTQGLTAADLPDLMRSGDLEIHLDGLDAQGATDATVEVSVLGAGGVSETFSIGSYTIADGPIIVTVPSDRPIEVDAEAVAGSSVLETRSGVMSPLDAGEDRRIDVCGSLGLRVEPSGIAPDGDTAEVTATVRTCQPDRSGVTVDFELIPTLTNGMTLSATSAVTDAAGEATITVTSGTALQDSVVSASAEVPAPAGTVTRTVERVIPIVGEYTHTVIARDGSPGYPSLGLPTSFGQYAGPSINVHGDVAFADQTATTDRIVVADASDDPDQLASALAAPADLPLATSAPTINDTGTVVSAWSGLVNGDVDSAIVLANELTSATFDELTRATASLGSSVAGVADDVIRPTIDNLGNVVFAARDDATGDTYLAEVDDTGAILLGEVLPAVSPVLADDGTIVVNTATAATAPPGSGLVNPFQEIVLVGGSYDDVRGLLAEGGVCGFFGTSSRCEPGAGGFRSVGRATISDNGAALAFIGDENDDGPGLHVALRTGPDPLNWTAPIRVIGGNLLAGDRELAGGVWFDEFEATPIGLTHVEELPAGPVGDVVVLAFKATPIAPGPTVRGTTGLFTVRAEVVERSDGSLDFLVADAVPVVQHGDAFDGGTVVGVDVFDPISTRAGALNPADHRVAAIVRTDVGRAVAVFAPPEEILGAPSAPPARTTAVVPRSLPRAPIVRSAPVETTPHDEPGIRRSRRRVVAQAPDASMITYPAYVLSPARGTSADDFEITNRSRDAAGNPVQAALDEMRLAPGYRPTLLAPDETIVRRFDVVGSAAVELATPVSDRAEPTIIRRTLRVDRGANQPPRLDFSNLVLPVGSGVTVDVTVIDPEGDSVQLAWDLDNDGTIDRDVATRRTLELTSAEAEVEICGGTCIVDQPYLVRVVGDDRRGNVVDIVRTLTFSAASTFELQLAPSLIKVSPGRSGGAFLDTVALGGFSGELALSVDGVPDGWTVRTPSGVEAGGSVEVTVTVPSDTPLDQATITIVGESAGVERRVDLTVTTVFGLVPRCAATIEVTVLDPSGAPQEGASVTFAPRTDADGRTSFARQLREGREVDTLRIGASHPDHFAPPSRDIRIECDSTVQATFRLLPRLSATVTGRVVEGVFNPFYSLPFPTDTPVADAAISDGLVTTTTAADGTFTYLKPQRAIDDYGLVSARASKPGYWPSTVGQMVGDSGVLDLGDIGLLRQCTVTIGGGTVVDQDGDPVEGAGILFGTVDPVAVTDADGRFDLDLTRAGGSQNRPRSFRLAVVPPSTPEWAGALGDAGFTDAVACGGTTPDVQLELDRPIPVVQRFGDLSGVITEVASGAPIDDAVVRVIDNRTRRTLGTMRTGPDGRYSFTDLEVGSAPADQTDPITTSITVQVSQPDHWPESPLDVLTSDTESTVDVELVARRFSSIVGRVSDRATDTAIEGASVIGGGQTTTTGPDGRYEISGVPLNKTGDTSVSVVAFQSDPRSGDRIYWQESAVVVLPDEQPATQDFALDLVCAGGDVSGVVVNAATLEPLEEVVVSISGAGSMLTGADGRFEFIDIEPGANNGPRGVRVNASKPGFFSASVDITIFCDSSIVVDFGSPSTELGRITGTVTEAGTGAPVAGVFIGSQFGGSTTTDDQGRYALERVPLNPDNSARTWAVTAIDGARRASAAISVPDSPDAVLDFVLGGENRPPMAFDQRVDVESGGTVEITLGGSDPEGDEIDFEIVDEPDAGTLTGTPPSVVFEAPDVDVETVVTFTFDTGDGAARSEPGTISITVSSPADLPPVIDAPPRIEVVAGGRVSFVVSGIDPEGEEVTLRPGGTPPGWITMTPDGAGRSLVTVTPTAADVGSRVYETIGSDGLLEASAATTVVVTPPVVMPTAAVTADGAPVDVENGVVVFEGDELVLDMSGSQAGSAGTLVYRWQVETVSGTDIATGASVRTGLISNHGGPALTLRPEDDSASIVVATVTDSVNAALMSSMRFDVTALNVAPGVQLIGVDVAGVPGAVDRPVAQAGRPFTLRYQVSDPGADTFSVDRLRDGVSSRVERDLVTLSLTPDTVGRVDFEFDVCDDDGGCGTWSGGFDVVEDPAASADSDGEPGNPTPSTPAGPPIDPVGELPATGQEAVSPLRISAVLVALGLIALLIARRRRLTVKIGPIRSG